MMDTKLRSGHDGLTNAERIEKNTRVFHFHGQATNDWPRWMFFTNFAYDGSRRIIIHMLDGRLVVNYGDTVKITQAGEMTVERT